jgi:hypothetical protein
MDIKKIIREEVNDFDWVGDVPEYHSILNKAFYFDPIAGQGDETYRKLIEHFKSLGFESKYHTPDNIVGDESIGLYTYRDVHGVLSYVYTGELHDDEDYEMHIKNFSDDESDHGSEGLEILDARDFIKDL